MRVLKTEDCFYVSGGDGDGDNGFGGTAGANDGYGSGTGTGGFGPGEGYGYGGAGMCTAASNQAPTSSNFGCSSGMTRGQYSTARDGWNQLAMVSSPFAAISGWGFAITVSAAAMGAYNNYCSWNNNDNGSR